MKEWLRKRIVKLKRNTKIIPYAYLIIVLFLWLIWLYTFSRTVADISYVEWGGMAIFIVTLFSILTVALFGSAFPKRKKVNIVMLSLLFVFLAIIILGDVLYYVKVDDYLTKTSGFDDVFYAEHPYLKQSLTLSIVHMVLVGVGIVLVATLPLYKKAINKINTRKVIEENNLSEGIDTNEEV